MTSMTSMEYFNGRASTWDDRVAVEDQSMLTAQVERMGLRSGEAVLDIGTGTGVLLPLLLRAVSPHGTVCGLDFASLMLLQACTKPANEPACCVLGDATRLPVKAGSFDAVVCYSSFPHFRDKPAALSEMCRVLKRGGRLFVCHSAGREDINRRHRSMEAVRRDLLPPGRSMRRMLAASGFCEILIEDSAELYFASARRSEL